MSFLETAKKRYTVRSYNGKPVEKEKLHNVIYAQCTCTSMSDIYRFSDMLGSGVQAEVHKRLQEQLRTACNEAYPVFETFVKKLEFQLD